MSDLCRESTGLNEKVVRNFVEAISRHDVDAMCSLMSDDHVFIDSQGHETAGKASMREGWIGYFRLFPDYRIEITRMFLDNDTVAAFGFAEGTFKGLSERKENHWRLPASWKATIKDGKIHLWQVYADAKIPFDIINRNKYR